jgi:hypothetical protein
LLGLFEENCQQGGLEGQQRFGLPDGGDVPARGGEEAVEDILVASAQRAAEGRQQTLGLVEMLGDGEDGATHNLEKSRLNDLADGFFFNQYFIGLLADQFQQESSFHNQRRRQRNHDWGGKQ